MPTALARNTLILLVNNAGSALLSFALTALIGRALGQDGLGVYATALAWVFPLSVAADFGLGTLITRDVAAQPADADAYLRQTARFRMAWGGGLALLLLLAAPLLSTDPAVVRGIQLAAPLVLIAPFFGAYSAVFRARGQMRPVALLGLGMLAAQVVLTVYVLLLSGDVLAVLLVNTVTSAGQLMTATAWYWRGRARSSSALGIKTAQTRALIRRALPFALAGVLAALQLRVGPLLLERLAGTGEAGLYAAANRFIEAARLPATALFSALLPALAALSAQPEQLHRTFARVMLGLAGAGLLAGLLALPLAGPVILLTYGAAFAVAETALQIAAWGLLPALLRAGLILYAYARGREGLVNFNITAALAMQTALCWVWLPLYGAAGLALAGLVVESAAGIMLAVLLFTHEKGRPHAHRC